MSNELARFAAVARVDPDATWTTQHGEVLLIREMKTTHVFHSLRMLWNHHCPVAYRVLPYREYAIRWSGEEVKELSYRLLDELLTRGVDDLSDRQVAELVYMLGCRKMLIEQASAAERITHES